MLKNKFLFLAVPVLFIALLTGCSADTAFPDKAADINGLQFEGRAENKYANQFVIDRYNNGYSMIQIANGEKYLIVPDNGEIPAGLSSNIKIIHCPANNIYLAATAAMDLFVSLGCGGNIKFSGTKENDWYIDYAAKAMQDGQILYAGKYREPDYELLMSEDCKLSVQSTMIDHTPDVKEKLEELGITVFTDYSSYENHPLGRCEWIKVYGEMLGKADEAEALLGEQEEFIKPLENTTETGKKVAFFYVSNSGQIIVRRPGDYISKMIELAGGVNALCDIDSSESLSTVTLEAEEFYRAAKDADIIIYNTNVGGNITTQEGLKQKYPLISDFKAFNDDNVWCTKNSLFQETMRTGEIIADFHSVITGSGNTLRYLYRLAGDDVNE